MLEILSPHGLPQTWADVRALCDAMDLNIDGMELELICSEKRIHAETYRDGKLHEHCYLIGNNGRAPFESHEQHSPPLEADDHLPFFCDQSYSILDTRPRFKSLAHSYQVKERDQHGNPTRVHSGAFLYYHRHILGVRVATSGPFGSELYWYSPEGLPAFVSDASGNLKYRFEWDDHLMRAYDLRDGGDTHYATFVTYGRNAHSFRLFENF